MKKNKVNKLDFQKLTLIELNSIEIIGIKGGSAVMVNVPAMVFTTKTFTQTGPATTISTTIRGY